jgi:hypothetical protein
MMAKFRIDHPVRSIRRVEDSERIALVTPAPGALGYLAAQYLRRSHRAVAVCRPDEDKVSDKRRPGLY